LLEGLEASDVKFNDVYHGVETIRYDSEYYLKNYLRIEKRIANNPDLFIGFSTLNLNVDGSAFYPALEPFYGQGNYPFIRVGDVKLIVDFENCVKVPFDILVDFPTLKHVKKGDIVLTKGGTIGVAGLITENACVSRDLIFINSSVLPEEDYIVLFLFLSSDFCYNQLVRSSSQSVQPHLTITLVRNLLVYKFSHLFKKIVAVLYNKSFALLGHSKSLYTIAESILLEESELHNWQPTIKNNNTKTLKKSYVKSGRIDAEYYQPKYDELESILKKTGKAIKLGTHLSLNKRGTQPVYSDDNKGIVVLNSKHIRQNKIDFTDNRFGNPNEISEELVIRKYDVLVNGTGVGTIGRTAVYMKEEPALPDNHITILRPIGIDPLFLSVQLNSIIGKLQVEKYFKGSSGQIELYPSDINDFIIWKAPADTQKKIKNAIEESERLRIESAILLETAKTAVEIAIEQDEKTALDYLEKLNHA
jgi:restriction endonuclease S subunit